MADITLAEFNGNVWLVGGEDHIDDLLTNTLPQDVTIEMVPCARKSDVHALWVQNCGESNFIGDPWIIHPAIVQRIRRTTPDYAVFFGQWSVLLDADALTVIRNAASWAAKNEAAPVLLTEYLEPTAPSALEGLSGLRAQLIADELARLGVARERITRVRRDVAELPGLGQESQRLDIVVRTS